jgi:hypothetical protein
MDKKAKPLFNGEVVLLQKGQGQLGMHIAGPLFLYEAPS